MGMLIILPFDHVRCDCSNSSDHRPQGGSDTEYISKIICSSQEAPCSCLGACNSTEFVSLLSQTSLKQLTGEECHSFCETSKLSNGTTTKCEYFRWEKEPGPNSTAVCSMMS